jgi:inhibitor of cysteine peptidase
MKKLALFGLVSILLLPLLMLGCKTEEPSTSPTASKVPALNGGQEAKMLELTIGDFSEQNNIVKDIELILPGSLTVSLDSNPTTGYQWGEAEISAPSVIAQVSRNFVEPEDTGVVGSGGTDVWTFDSKAAGTATIKMSYGRPWEGGEKDTFTLTINVTVK